MSNLSENNQSTLQIIKSWFWKGEEAATKSDAELNQKVREVSEDLKSEQINTFAATLAELVKAEATKLNEDYTAQLKTETDGIIGELRTEVANLEKQISEFKAIDIDAKVSEIKKDFGAQLLEFTSKVSTGLPLGDGKTIETHEPPKASIAPVKIFGAKVATA